MGCLLILAVTLDRFFGASRKNLTRRAPDFPHSRPARRGGDL